MSYPATNDKLLIHRIVLSGPQKKWFKSWVILHSKKMYYKLPNFHELNCINCTILFEVFLHKLIDYFFEGDGMNQFTFLSDCSSETCIYTLNVKWRQVLQKLNR